MVNLQNRRYILELMFLVLFYIEWYVCYYVNFVYQHCRQKVYLVEKIMKYLITYQGCCNAFHQYLESQGKSIHVLPCLIIIYFLLLSLRLLFE